MTEPETETPMLALLQLIRARTPEQYSPRQNDARKRADELVTAMRDGPSSEHASAKTIVFALIALIETLDLTPGSDAYEAVVGMVALARRDLWKEDGSVQRVGMYAPSETYDEIDAFDQEQLNSVYKMVDAIGAATVSAGVPLDDWIKERVGTRALAQLFFEAAKDHTLLNKYALDRVLTALICARKQDAEVANTLAPSGTNLH